MKVVNVSGEKVVEGKRAVINRTLSNLAPSATRAAQQSQETVIETFKKILDNRFQIVQGLRFPGIEGLGPLLLVGPSGFWLLEANPASGIFRAVQDQWEEMDSKARTFRPARVNIIGRTLAAAAAMQAVLSNLDDDLPPVEPVILFTHPGAHLELQQPAIRLIQADAIARFAAGLHQVRPVFEPEAVQIIVDYFSRPEQVPEIPEVEPLPDEPRPAGAAQPVRLPAIPEEEPELIKRISRKASFSRYQWSVLALLLVLNLFVLIAAIVIILIIT